MIALKIHTNRKAGHLAKIGNSDLCGYYIL